jgi:hypothetical protein
MMLKILNASSQQHFVQLLIQRVKESEWSNVPKNGHKASLYYFDLRGGKNKSKYPLKTKEIINRDSYSIKKVSWIKKGYRYSWGFMDLGIQTGSM